MSADEISIAEAVKLGAARITGARPTEKAAPVTEDAEKAVDTEDTEKGELPEAFKKNADKKDEGEEEGEDKKEKETEKGLPATELITATPYHETPEFSQAVERAVEKALAPILALLTTVEKSVGLVDTKVSSTLEFQSATTDVLVGLKTEQAELRDTTKSLAVEVEKVGAQPAGRKSIDTRETEKSVEAEEKPALPTEEFLGKLRGVTKSMEVNDGLLVMRLAKRGQVDEALSRLNAKQRAQLSR